MNTWISSAVIYQINLRSLAHREPRNAFEAATETPVTESPLVYVTGKLPVIQKLGVNTLYLMPPFVSGLAERKGIGSPYAIRDYRAVDPEYGTLEELQAFVRTAHELGFKVIFDITPNHSSRDNVWVESHPEYFVRREDGSLFHDLDWSDTAKLDYRQPGLRREMVAFYDYWLGFLGKDADGRPDGIDGFRLDMAHFINDKSFWNEAMPVLKERHAGRQLLFLAECYGLHNNLDLFERGINAAYDDDFYKICNHLYGVTEQFETRIVPERGLENRDDFRDRYEAFLERGIAGAFETALMNYESRLPAGEESPHVARYTDNHDEGRGMYLYGEGAVRAVNALIFLSPHTMPFLLTGEEFGAENRPPIHDRINPIGKLRRIVHGDGYREQQSVEFEGNIFLRTHARRQDLYRFFQELIKLRMAHPALTRGTFELWDAGEVCEPAQRSVVAFTRTHEGVTLRCAVNMGPEDRTLRQAGPLRNGTAVYGGLDGDTLKAFQAVVTSG